MAEASKFLFATDAISCGCYQYVGVVLVQTSSRSVVKLRRLDEGTVGFAQPALIAPGLSSQSCDANECAAGRAEHDEQLNSTPNLVAWLAEYRKYLILVAVLTM